MKHKIKITEEEAAEANKQRELKDLQERIDNGSLPAPTRFFNVGEPVKCGGMQNITVKEVLLNGYGYILHYDYIDNQSQVKHKVGYYTGHWLNVFPMTSYCEGEQLSIKDDIDIRYSNNDINSLLHKVYYTGVDFNPSYQRDLVWSDEQKTSLLDSIFNSIDIGKFTFIKHDYSRTPFFYEILDGKQRLSTICQFYEDRFLWKGKKFSELCWKDARHFNSFPVIQGEVGEMTEQQIYKLFIKMNTSGTPVSQEHLDKIKSLIKP